MIRTIASVLITLALLLGVSLYEVHYVQATFDQFEEILHSLQHKTVIGTVSYDDGLAVREFWDENKKMLHVWVPHTVLFEIDYQLDEAIGFLFVEEYSDALPKIEVLLGLSENVPDGYTFSLGNIF